MVVALGPGKFYGSSLPRPRIYTDVKLNDERVDPPVPVTDALLSWAHEAHWSMGGLSFKRLRLQGRIEGNVEKLRKLREKKEKWRARNSPEDAKARKGLSTKGGSGVVEGGKKRVGTVSPPPAPVASKKRRFMDLQHLTALEYLSVSDCKALSSLSNDIGHLTSLSSLTISYCPNLRFPPEGIRNLTRLEKLQIDDCEALPSLPSDIGHLTSLSSLHISKCPNLRSLPEGIRNLTRLEELVVYDCKALSSLPNDIGYLTSLSFLSIANCPNLRSLPEGIRNLTRLEHLKIDDCKALSSLPNDIGHLTSLSSLSIRECPNLGSLPEGIRNLTRLESLFIDECPCLERSCKKNGKDWNIAHVRCIFTNGKRLYGD